MEEDKAHRLYVTLKEQGAGATFNKHGLGFTGAPGPAPSSRPTQLYDGAPRGLAHPGMRLSHPEALGPPRQPGTETFPHPGPRPPFGLPPPALAQAGPPFARPQMPPNLPGPPARAAPPGFHHPGMAPQMPMRPQQMPPQMVSPTGPPPGVILPQLWRPAPPRAPPGEPWPVQHAPPGLPPGMQQHQYAPPPFLQPQGQSLRAPPPDQLSVSAPPPAAVAHLAAQSRAGAGPTAPTAAPLPPPDSGATHQPQQHAAAANGGGSGGGGSGRHMDMLAVLRAWTAHKSDNGQVYYFNPLTNASSWVKPEGFTGGVSEAVPTSQLRVPGTAWFEIHCEDGRKYYHNDKTEETSWTIPPEVAAVKQHVQEAKIGVPTSAVAAANRKNVANGLAQMQDDDEDVTYTEEDIGLPPLPQEPHSPEPPMPDGDVAGPPLPQLPDPEPRKSVEELASDFHDLLAEQGVTPFSRWERELPKLIGDARYQAVPTLKERKQLFEDFCKSSAEFRSRARANGKAGGSAPQPADGSSEEAANAFKVLLLEAARTAKPLEEGEAEEGESSSQMLMQADTTFEVLEQRFGDDPRWQACNESSRRLLFEAELAAAKAREQLTAQKSVEALEADFRALLVSSGINGSSRWSRSKDSLAKDSRFKAVAKESREQLFRDFVAGQKKEEDGRVREKREREQKEQAAAERLKREAGEAERRQKKAAHSDAVANYMTLLNEAVKDPAAHWSDWRSKLQRDPQGRGSNPELDAKEAEGRFRDHVENLQKKAVLAFTDLLEQVIKPLLPGSKTTELPPELRSFSKAEKLWHEDPCASKLSSKERERLWRRFVEDILLDRDDPEKAARRLRLSGRTRPSERERPAALRDEQQPDKAYEREYLAHDRKRLRRD